MRSKRHVGADPQVRQQERQESESAEWQEDVKIIVFPIPDPSRDMLIVWNQKE